jgi:hypothetical protein
MDVCFGQSAIQPVLSERNRSGSQAVNLPVRRVAYRHRSHFHIVTWELILEPQRISKAAIRRFCMSIELEDKILVSHVMSCINSFHETPL